MAGSTPGNPVTRSTTLDERLDRIESLLASPYSRRSERASGIASRSFRGLSGVPHSQSENGAGRAASMR